MKRASTHGHRARRALILTMVCAALAVSGIVAQAFTTAQFSGIQSQLTSDIGTLSAVENLPREERSLLRTLSRATNVLEKTSASDGKTLRSLNTILGRTPGYTQFLTAIASNLLAGFNKEYIFVGSLLGELPPSPQQHVVETHYTALEPLVERLNQAGTIAKFSVLYDASKARLDQVFVEANQALIVPFPKDLSPNSVKAKINNVNFSASSDSSTENSFSAVVTETNIIVNVQVVGPSQRGILFSIPNVQPGTFRYSIPDSAVFTNRTDIDYFNHTETQAGATSGTIFVSTTTTEVYGVFMCSGPGFEIVDGRFRITLSSQP